MKDKLDEWIYFFKNAEIKNDFSARGLKAAGEKLDEMKLTEKEAKEYKKYLKELRDIASDQHTKMADAQEIVRKRNIEIAQNLLRNGLDIKLISASTDLSVEEVAKLAQAMNK